MLGEDTNIGTSFDVSFTWSELSLTHTNFVRIHDIGEDTLANGLNVEASSDSSKKGFRPYPPRLS